MPRGRTNAQGNAGPAADGNPPCLRLADVESDEELVAAAIDQEQVDSPEDVEKLAKAAKDQKKGALLLLLNRGGNQLFVGLDVGQA